MNQTINFNEKQYNISECIETVHGLVPNISSLWKIDPVTNLKIKTDMASSKVIIGKAATGVYKYETTAFRTFAVEIRLGNKTIYAANEQVAEELGFIYDKKTYTYIDKKLSKDLPIRSRELRFDYHPKSLQQVMQKKLGLKSSTFRVTDGIKYTFGVEIETSKGSIPSHARLNLPLNSVFDGSIRDNTGNKVGTEYTTLPLIGDNGFVALKRSLNTMIRYQHSQNSSCSIHVHLGGAEFNKQTVVALWGLCQLLENELFLMLPKTRSTSDHCRLIEKIDIYNPELKTIGAEIERLYEIMLKIVGCTSEKSLLSKQRQHPKGPKCHYDKTTPRYWWVNFVPAMFNMRGNGVNTIEFRNHSASRNYGKIKNWILITMAILNYAENYPHSIFTKKSLSLKELIETVYSTTKARDIVKYINERKRLFVGNRDAIEYTPAENREHLGNNIKSVI